MADRSVAQKAQRGGGGRWPDFFRGVRGAGEDARPALTQPPPLLDVCAHFRSLLGGRPIGHRGSIHSSCVTDEEKGGTATPRAGERHAGAPSRIAKRELRGR